MLAGRGARALSLSQAELEVAARAVETLEKFNMCIIHNILSPADVRAIYSEYQVYSARRAACLPRG